MEQEKQKEKRKPFSRIKVLFKIINDTHLWPMLIGFIIFFFAMVTLIYFLDTESFDNNYGNALWFGFASIFTIGYGDYSTVSILGRIFTVILVIYAVLIIAMVPAIIVNYLTEINHRKREMTDMEFVEKMKRLPELSKEELQELSDKIKARVN